MAATEAPQEGFATGELIRWGFADTTRARADLESLRALDQNVVADLDDRGWPALMEGVTDPNLALSTLARLYDDHPGLGQ